MNHHKEEHQSRPDDAIHVRKDHFCLSNTNRPE